MADMTAQGVQTAGALSDADRKAQAYNALSAAYGPAIAYSPENALNAAFTSANIPLATQTAQATLESTKAATAGKLIENAQTQNENQRLAAYRAANMLQSQAGTDGSIPSDAYDKIVRPNASLFGIDPEHVDALGQLLSQPGGADHLQQIKQSMLGPQKASGGMTQVVGPDGQVQLMRTDQYGNPMAPIQLGNGFTTAQVMNAGSRKEVADVNTRLAPVKVGIQQQNANTNAFRANTTANNSAMGNPTGFAGAATSAKGSANSGAAPVQSQPVGDPQALFNRLPVGSKARQNAIASASQVVNSGTQLRNANMLLDQVDKQISPYTAGTGTLLKDLPGSQQADLKANLKTLSAQGLTAWISSLKNSSGQTGIGRVLQSEANAAMTLFGNMEQDQSAKQLAFHAQLFRQAVNRLYQNQQSAYKQQYGVLPHEAAGTTDPMQSPAPSGWKVIR